MGGHVCTAHQANQILLAKHWWVYALPSRQCGIETPLHTSQLLIVMA